MITINVERQVQQVAQCRERHQGKIWKGKGSPQQLGEDLEEQPVYVKDQNKTDQLYRHFDAAVLG